MNCKIRQVSGINFHWFNLFVIQIWQRACVHLCVCPCMRLCVSKANLSFFKTPTTSSQQFPYMYACFNNNSSATCEHTHYVAWLITNEWVPKCRRVFFQSKAIKQPRSRFKSLYEKSVWNKILFTYLIWYIMRYNCKNLILKN